MTVPPLGLAGMFAMRRAFSRFAHVVAYVCLGGAFASIVVQQVDHPGVGLVGAILAPVVIAGCLWVSSYWRSVVLSSLCLLLAACALCVYAVVLLQSVPSVHDTRNFLISLVEVAVFLIGGAGVLVSSAIIWSVVGFALAEAAIALAAAIVGVPFAFDLAATVLAAILVAALAIVGVGFTVSLRARPRLQTAAIEEEVSSMRLRIEANAAALMHDTVLGHLASIENSTSGRLTSSLRASIERDLEVLRGKEWLRGNTEHTPGSLADDWHTSAVFAAVENARALGLDIVMAGDLHVMGSLDRRRDEALGLAVAQCLVNVARHAGVSRAELVVTGTERDVSVMVVDEGRGFRPESVEEDRFGLRHSVRFRIDEVGGSVALWSRPGQGTSVMITVPATVESAAARDAP